MRVPLVLRRPCALAVPSGLDATRPLPIIALSVAPGKSVTWQQITAADFEFEPKLDDVRLDMQAPVKPDATGNYPLSIPGVTKYL